MVAGGEKFFIRNLNVIDTNCYGKYRVDWISTIGTTLKMYILRKKTLKNKFILNFMTIFHDFSFTIEIG